MSTVRAIRRRPTIVPAMQYRDRADEVDLRAFVAAAFGRAPDAERADDLVMGFPDGLNVWNQIHSQWLRVAPGDWVVAGSSRGDVYPLAPEELATSYDLVDPDGTPSGEAWDRLRRHP